MLLLELRPLETLRQGLADGLLDDPGTGKADQSAGLRQDDIAQRGETGSDPTSGGVRKDGNIQKPFLREAGQRRTGLGHLHQGEDALLHPGTAAGGEQDQGQAVLGGVLNGQGDLLTHGGTHGAHEEAAVQHTHYAFAAPDGAGGGDHGLRQAGLALGGLHLGPVAGEGERVRRRQLFKQLPEGAGVQNRAESIVGADGEMVAALGADRQVLRHGFAVAVLPALGTGDGFIAGNVIVPDGLHGQQARSALGEDAVHPTHASTPLSLSLRLNSSSSDRCSSRKAVVHSPRMNSGWYRI